MSLQYIIDGYNVTNHPSFTRQLTRKPADSRFFLIQLIKRKKLCGSNNNLAWVVFDGYPDASMEPLGDKNIKVVFSRMESADYRIKKIVESVSNPKSLVIVSDDKEIKFFINSCGAKSLSVENFLTSKDKARGKPYLSEEDNLTYSQMHRINEELKRLWLS